MPSVARLCLLLAALAAVHAAHAADPLFENHETLAVTIEAPIEEVRRQRDSDEYHDGKLRYQEADGSERELDIKLRARGRYRRQLSTCPFPPIRLNFRKKQVDDTLFDGQDKIKLVTHCRTGSERYEQHTLREYLVYRYLQTLTDLSFRVRLLRITWVDNDTNDEPFVHYGFLLEDEDRLGKRIGLKPANQPRVPLDEIDSRYAALLSAFQFMIGNTDWSMLAGPADENCCHNTVPYRSDDGLYPIPYDFDFAGAVDAPYASPNPEFKIRKVTTRLYRGRCEHNSELAAAISAVRAQQAVIMQLVQDQEGLEDRTRKRVSRFLEDFFEDIANPKYVERRLIRRCV